MSSAAPTSTVSHSEQNRASLALFLGTIFWGFGFTWAKVGGKTINAAMGLGDGAPLGPILLLGARFLAAGVVWTMIFPAARRRWSAASLARAGAIGLLLALGLAVQHLGLDRTSAAVSAFLTSLTIVFVPLLSTLALRKPPKLIAWLAVPVATAGVWLMTGATPSGFGWGEVLGLACAFTFSVYVLVVNALVPRDDPFRMTGGPFLVTGLLMLAIVPALQGGPGALSPGTFVTLFAKPSVGVNCALLVVFPTLIAYGLLTHFQPKLDATRAALIYLLEPVFATLYAWLMAGEAFGGREMLGAAMILAANALVEVIDAWQRRPRTPADLAPREPV